jgi:hypothetical protein
LRVLLFARVLLDCIDFFDFDRDAFRPRICADAFTAGEVVRFRRGVDNVVARFVGLVAARFLPAAAVRRGVAAAVRPVAIRGAERLIDATAGFAARVALSAVLVAVLAVRRAALCAVLAADSAASDVESATPAVAFPASGWDDRPVISAARSVSCVTPSTLAASPRLIAVAPASIRSPTARADCSTMDSVSGFRGFISPPQHSV